MVNDEMFTSGEFTSGETFGADPADQVMFGSSEDLDWTLEETPETIWPDGLEIVSVGQEMSGEVAVTETTTEITTESVIKAETQTDLDKTETLNAIAKSLSVIVDYLDNQKNEEITTEEFTTEITSEYEDRSETTTSYYVVLDNRIDNVQRIMEIQARDQQLIGRIGIGCMMALFGGIIIWLFLGRIR